MCSSIADGTISRFLDAGSVLFAIDLDGNGLQSAIIHYSPNSCILATRVRPLVAVTERALGSWMASGRDQGKGTGVSVELIQYLCRALKKLDWPEGE